jgi:hypothetical protein
VYATLRVARARKAVESARRAWERPGARRDFKGHEQKHGGGRREDKGNEKAAGARAQVRRAALNAPGA